MTYDDWGKASDMADTDRPECWTNTAQTFRIDW